MAFAFQKEKMACHPARFGLNPDRAFSIRRAMGLEALFHRQARDWPYVDELSAGSHSS
mgnify:CR=1 FL=1